MHILRPSFPYSGFWIVAFQVISRSCNNAWTSPLPQLSSSSLSLWEAHLWEDRSWQSPVEQARAKARSLSQKPDWIPQEIVQPFPLSHKPDIQFPNMLIKTHGGKCLSHTHLQWHPFPSPPTLQILSTVWVHWEASAETVPINSHITA